MNRFLPVAGVLGIAAIIAACGSSDDLTGPSAECQQSQMSVSGDVTAFPPEGTKSFLTISAAESCTWSAATSADWIDLTSGASGSGSGKVEFLVRPNSAPHQRAAAIRVNRQALEITQVGASCRITVAHDEAISDGGGALAITITAGDACSWTAVTHEPWITVKDGGSGTGSGTIHLSVAPNPGAERVGTLTLAGQTIRIVQRGGCYLSISPASHASAAAGGAAATAVTGDANCAWTATSNDGWIAVTSGGTGTGAGTVNFTIAANAGPARSGTVTVAGKIVTVTQADGCAPSISPTNAAFGSAGAAGSTAVTAGAGCAWTAASNDAWIAVTSGGNGTGDGAVNFTVAANAGPARTGTLTVAGDTFTVTQASGCASSISPTGAAFGAGGGAGSTNVTSGGGCAWTAASNDGWIAVTSGSTGTGHGAVNFTVAANAGPARTGTLTVAGETFTVTQAGGCSSSISPTSAAFAAGGGAGSTTVTAGAGCGWTAASNDAWIVVTSGANGAGNGAVNFTVAANAGPARTGTLTVGGDTFTVTQASGCAPSISPTSGAFAAGGGAGSTTVTAGGGCAWTAASNDGWIAVTSGANGAGNGAVNFTVAANVGPARTGTLSVAGDTYTVTQANGCTYAISPDNTAIGIAGGSGSVAITAGAGCAWTAVSNAAWIVVTAGANGSGNGTVNYTVGVNDTLFPRSGTITIGGKTFTVNQGI